MASSIRAPYSRRVVLAGLLTGAITSSARTQAAYPDHVLRGIVPFSPGGASDILARLYADQLGRVLGQTVVVENRPGAGGNIGIQAAVQARPDGYTILLCSIATTQNPAVFRNLPYDPFKDLNPRRQTGRGAVRYRRQSQAHSG
jgi:tripartite-type tricarboxylate transporter receptor subunit TctC